MSISKEYDFIIESETIRLIPLNEAGIEERVIWNTTVTEWKMEESGMITVQSIDENSYRLKKESEIKSNGKFVNGIYTSLEIYTLGYQHIGFINCYPFHNNDSIVNSVAIGIVIPERQNRSKGYGTEALRLYTQYLLKSGIRELILITKAENKVMQAVGEKCGFHKYTVLSDNRLLLSNTGRI